MPSNRHRGVISIIAATILLTPALIWGGMRTFDAAMNDGTVKLPAFSTVGPKARTYTLTPLEREKLLLPATESPLSNDFKRPVPSHATIRADGEYSGMTPAELEKLARVREASPRIKTTRSQNNQDPFSTIKTVPRVPGIEGLTPRERAKLETYLRSRQ